MNSVLRAALLTLALLAAPLGSMAQIGDGNDPISTLMGHKSLQENLADVPVVEEILRKEAVVIGTHGPLEVTLIFTSMGQQLGRALETRGQAELGARVFNFSTTTQNQIIERLAVLEQEDKVREKRESEQISQATGGLVPIPTPKVTPAPTPPARKMLRL